jgi:hypothetical protein
MVGGWGAKRKKRKVSLLTSFFSETTTRRQSWIRLITLVLPLHAGRSASMSEECKAR